MICHFKLDKIVKRGIRIRCRKVVNFIRQIATSVMNKRFSLGSTFSSRTTLENCSKLKPIKREFFISPWWMQKGKRKMLKPNVEWSIKNQFKASISIKTYCDCRFGVNHFPSGSLLIQSASSNWFVCLQIVQKNQFLLFLSWASTHSHKLFIYSWQIVKNKRWKMKRRGLKINVCSWL